MRFDITVASMVAGKVIYVVMCCISRCLTCRSVFEILLYLSSIETHLIRYHIGIITTLCSLYFGDDHDGINLSTCDIRDSSASYGGGIYVAQFNINVIITRLTLFNNSAALSGGAIMALAQDITVTDSVIDSNKAAQASGLYIYSHQVNIRSCSFLDNVADSQAGALYVYNATSLDLKGCDFTRNMASSGAAVMAALCVDVAVDDCEFIENQARAYGGGVEISTTTNANISNVIFGRNVAVDRNGGALYMELITHARVWGCEFDSNRAVHASGSAIFVSDTAVSITSNTFHNNSAPEGGGTVYWETVSGMAEPEGLNVSGGNYFGPDNSAKYGPHVATDSTHLGMSSSNVYTITDYTAPVPSMEVSMLDYYDQVVTSESAAVMVVSSTGTVCSDGLSGYVTGGVVVQVEEGFANFSSMFAYCAPGFTLTLNVVCPSPTLLTAQVSFGFRACVRGEYYADRVCSECELGTYSLTDPNTTTLSQLSQIDVCKECPSGVRRCQGDQLVLKSGQWRISDSAETILGCPFGESSCQGGTGAGEGLCREGYEGVSGR